MGELVYLKRNDVYTDSMVVANGTGVQHKSVIALVKKQSKRLEKYGPLEFVDLKSLNSKRGRPTKICLLNEQQATLLVTFMDNSDIVADFKTELVGQFYAMRDILHQKKTAEWIAVRNNSKLVRKDETDTIKEFVDYALSQGSEHAEMYYKHFSSLANKACGIDNRDFASILQLSTLTIVERIILVTIQSCMRQGLPYKEIYKRCKAQIDTFGDMADLPSYNNDIKRIGEAI